MGSAGCGVARLKTQSVGAAGRMLRNSRHHPLPPWGVASARELGSASCLVATAQAGWNSVRLRSIACMMTASRLASAIRALRIDVRFAMAMAQSFSFSGPL